MKVLFIGGTGDISAACSRLALDRGNLDIPELKKAVSIRCDINYLRQKKSRYKLILSS
ncbi:MAG: hypothetical protein ISS19_18965 [Bacteroidales bacterium]|nr:hypothetical protein [Bacteroidales bacterium]